MTPPLTANVVKGLAAWRLCEEMGMIPDLGQLIPAPPHAPAALSSLMSLSGTRKDPEYCIPDDVNEKMEVNAFKACDVQSQGCSPCCRPGLTRLRPPTSGCSPHATRDPFSRDGWFPCTPTVNIFPC